MKKKVMLFMMAVSLNMQAAVLFTGTGSAPYTQGNITDLSGAILGTWTRDRTGTSGFTAASTDVVTFGSSAQNGGMMVQYGSLTGANDVFALGLTITPAAGFMLTTVTIGQCISGTASGSNGSAGGYTMDNSGTATSPVGTNYQITGYTGSFSYYQGLDPISSVADGDEEITAPTISGSNLVWRQVDNRVYNSNASWYVNLTGINTESAYTVNFKNSSSQNLGDEFSYFNAVITPVPEAGSFVLLSMTMLLSLTHRRRH